MKLSCRARRLVAGALVALGCGVGASIWALAAPEPPNPLDEYEQSKRYDAELERVGGKSAVFGAELQDFLASLFRGPTLGLTIGGLSLVVAGGFLFFTRERGERPREA